MRQWTITWTVLGGAFTLSFELVLDIFGGRKVITEALPIIEAFAPIVGIAILSGTVAWVLRYSWQRLHAWDRRKASRIAADLGLIQSREDLLDIGMMPDRRRASQQGLVVEKYQQWFFDEHGQKLDPFGEAASFRATHFSEILSMYGFIRGRRKIRDELIEDEGDRERGEPWWDPFGGKRRGWRRLLPRRRG